MVTNGRLATRINHAGMHGNALADHTVGADNKLRFLALVFYVLRFATQYGTVENNRLCTRCAPIPKKD